MAPVGVLLLAAGAILYWAVDLDVPYVEDDALGAILMMGGIVALVLAALSRSQFGDAGAGGGVALIVAGAIVFWALTVDIPRVDNDGLGAVLMVVGILAVGVSVAMGGRTAGTSAGLGLALVAVGAILYWAVDLDLPFVIDDAMAVILMVAGAVAIVLAVVTHRRRSRATQVP